MDAFNMIVNVPSWAYDFCYYYLAVAAIVAIYSVWALVQLFTLPGMVKRFIPLTTLALAIILSGAVSTVLSMMQFWVCRSALKPATKEKFAVKCGNEGDCKAVMGVPQDELCSCGARGLCGGCRMNNNMEPASLPEYGEAFAPLAEGFAVHRPGKSGVAAMRR